jgi:HEAT repeat protein/predicted amidohydrolase
VQLIDQENIHNYCLDNNPYVRSEAARTLASAFFSMSDKQKAWEDLHRLINDGDNYVRSDAAKALASIFSEIPDKQNAWEDLHRLTNDVDIDVRSWAADALGSAFSQIPDKQKAWEDLHRLTIDKNWYVRSSAAFSLGSVFAQISAKQEAWEDLHRLTNDEDHSVRSETAKALGSAFSQIPDKQKAWEDLHRLTIDNNWYVRSNATSSLGSAYSHMPNKQQVWNDLHKLTNDEEKKVRTNANHSLGKISIFKASQEEREEDYKKELETAVIFFEKASQESPENYNPSQFCLPFYRSFYNIIFEKQEAKKEIDKYLKEAKSAIKGSKSKGLLLEAVENLANALNEVQNSENLDLNAKKSELNFYRRYCENVTELMRDTEETAPFATAAVKRGLPLFDRRLKDLPEKIHEIAKAICKQTRGTPAEHLGLETNTAAKELLEYRDDTALDISLNKQIENYKNYCGFIILGRKSQFIELIEETKNMDFVKKLEGITKINDYILRNALFPRIENILIADRVKENVRIASVQLNYTLSENFPYRIKDEDKEGIKKKICHILSKAQEEEVNILCLPELCYCEEWLPEIRNLCQKMIVISGTYYDNTNHNICKLITDSKIETSPQLKIIPSDFEESNLIGQRMIPGEKVLNVYESQFGKFAVLICRDFGNFSSHLKGIADIIFCPSYNAANDRFHNIAHIHVTDSPVYIIISNASQFGGTSIFGRIKKDYMSALEQYKCKEKGDTSYKLCQIEKEKEGMIIADFNLIYKYPPLQTPMHPDDEIMPVKNIKKLIF